ncbi:transposase [Streptomyces sp. NPDC001635]
MKNDIRDASDLADLLRMGRLPESWIAPPEVRELRELVHYRAKLVALRSGLKAQVHAVLAEAGILIAVSDLFGVEGRSRLEQTPLSGPYAQRVTSLLHLVDILDAEEAVFNPRIADRLRGHPGCAAIRRLPGIDPVLAAVFVAEIGDVHRFTAAEKLCSWAGLTPRNYESDTLVRRGHVTKQGSKLVRLGRRGSDPAQGHPQDRRRPGPDRGPPRQEHRENRRGPQTAHSRLLRPP